jgi:hypothetical protein
VEWRQRTKGVQLIKTSEAAAAMALCVGSKEGTEQRTTPHWDLMENRLRAQQFVMLVGFVTVTGRLIQRSRLNAYSRCLLCLLAVLACCQAVGDFSQSFVLVPAMAKNHWGHWMGETRVYLPISISLGAGCPRTNFFAMRELP